MITIIKKYINKYTKYIFKQIRINTIIIITIIMTTTIITIIILIIKQK
jgi:hypothetical protein